MHGIRAKLGQRPVWWFFAISLRIELAVVAVFLASGAADKLEVALRATGFEGRTDFVSAGRLVVLEPGSWLGVLLSVLQPLSPDIAAFVVAGFAFGMGGVLVLLRRYRFWSKDVGWRNGLGAWGLMFLTFLAMSLATAGLNHQFAPPSSFEWVVTPILSWSFPLTLLASVFLDIGGVTEETGWRGFALPQLQARMTPLAATVTVGLMWGVWHFPARPDILAGTYGLAGGALVLGILVIRFLFLSVVMTYFYNRAGGSTLIAISMHGLHNDSAFLQGRINADGLEPYVVSELTLLAPIVVVACILLSVSGRWLGLDIKAGRGSAANPLGSP
jgi:membrane protease YdiL (CAAX protease family)